MSSEQLLCRLEELPDGDARGFDPQGRGRDTMFVVRQGEALFAYRNACPHYDGSPLPWRRHAYLNPDRSRIVCHGHGAQFEIATGRCLQGACLGQSLDPLVVRTASDGAVYLVLNPHEEQQP